MDNGCLAILTDRGVISVSGEDATPFLHGLVTQNIENLKPGDATYAALLTPQGKVLFDFLVLAREGGYTLDCPRAFVADLTRRLGIYKLRAKVEIADQSDQLAVAALWDAPGNVKPPRGGFAFTDPRADGLGTRLIAAEASLQELAKARGWTRATPADYDAHRIALGVPEGGKDYGSGEVFAHDACIDQLSGLDFYKGCYVGQEVVSRMHHRGTARKRFVAVHGADLPEPGATVTAGSTNLGRLTSVAGHDGLALLRVDRAGEALSRGDTVKAGDTPVELVRPGWAAFDFPVPAA
ncbi:MAG: YgfZ/GcvT domain-containing protein [Dichotomicrobium sp.]